MQFVFLLRSYVSGLHATFLIACVVMAGQLGLFPCVREVLCHVDVAMTRVCAHKFAPIFIFVGSMAIHNMFRADDGHRS